METERLQSGALQPEIEMPPMSLSIESLFTKMVDLQSPGRVQQVGLNAAQWRIDFDVGGVQQALMVGPWC